MEGGDLFGIWQTNGSPSGFQTLAVRNGALRAIYNHDGARGLLAPGLSAAARFTRGAAGCSMPMVSP